MSASIIAELRCMKEAIVNAVTGGTSAIDYTALFNQVIAELQGIDANTDDLEATLIAINSDTSAITTNTANTVIALNEVINKLTSIDQNTDGVETLLSDILTQLQLPAPENTQMVRLEDACISVDGAPASYANPVLIYNTITNMVVAKQWFTNLGDLIVGAVTEADPCDCKCLDCDPVVDPDPIEWEVVNSIDWLNMNEWGFYTDNVPSGTGGTTLPAFEAELTAAGYIVTNAGAFPLRVQEATATGKPSKFKYGTGTDSYADDWVLV